MIGTIETYRRDFGVGILTAEDGRKYRFKRDEIVNPRLNLIGEEVDFELDGLTPKAIIVLASSIWNVFSGTPATPLFAGAPASIQSRLAA